MASKPNADNEDVLYPVYAEAMALKRAGYRPWPLQPGTSIPVQGVGVDHRTHGGKSHVPLTDDEIVTIWRKDRNVPGLGAVLDRGQYVLDLDPKNDPAVTAMFDDLRQMTRCDETPHGGLHAHFLEAGLTGVPWARISTKGIDLLTEGSFVALPPDRGRRWTGATGVDVKDNVETFARAFVGRRGYGFETNASIWRSDDGEDRIIPDHARNNTLASIGGLLRKIGIAPNLVRSMLYGVGTDPSSIETPLSDGEIEAVSSSMSRRISEAFNLDDLDVETITSDDDVPPLRWLIHHVIPNDGLTIIHGLPAAGKSWIGISLCVACATGRPWDGNEAVSEKVRVLYLDWERRGDMVRRRLKAYAQNYGATIDYVAMRGSLRSRIDFIRMLVASRGYGLLLIDSLTISMMGADVSNSGEVIPTMFDLQDVCDDFRIAAVILDHQRRPQAGENRAEAGAFGSIFKEAVATMQWQALKTTSEFTKGFMDLKLRLHKKNHEAHIPDIPMRLVFEQLPDGEVHNAYLLSRPEETVEDRIISILDGDTCDINELCGKTGLKSTRVRELVGNLISAGLVYIVNEGGGRGNRTTYGLTQDKTGGDYPIGEPVTPEEDGE